MYFSNLKRLFCRSYLLFILFAFFFPDIEELLVMGWARSWSLGSSCIVSRPISLFVWIWGITWLRKLFGLLEFNHKCLINLLSVVTVSRMGLCRVVKRWWVTIRFSYQAQLYFWNMKKKMWLHQIVITIYLRAKSKIQNPNRNFKELIPRAEIITMVPKRAK